MKTQGISASLRNLREAGTGLGLRDVPSEKLGTSPNPSRHRLLWTGGLVQGTEDDLAPMPGLLKMFSLGTLVLS